MKQKLYTAGLINIIVILTGAIFKISHLPGAGIIFTLGMVSFVLLVMPASLVSVYREKRENGLLYLITGMTCFVVFTAMLFKIMHWPFAGTALTIAIPFPYLVFLPVFIYSTSRNSSFSLYSTVLVLFLIALNSVFNVLLAVR
ncbi:MAG: hypothetical protein ACM3QX_17185 [Syntrophomonadaceae bacterium]